ncbi:MAG: lytic transglycosylase domain-containing protein [Deltaproteobacteria bacterium]|nr:lytic transglycosylase domain-containing protein [Deltaproteobacteria bacterium]
MPNSRFVALALILSCSFRIYGLIPLPFSLETQRDKELPNFGKQTKALGYSGQETFRVTPELEKRVAFWKRIYTELTSSQALIHDSEYPELSYHVVDISPYTENTSSSYAKRMAAMNNFFTSEKQRIANQLKILHRFSGPTDNLPVELQTLAKKFEGIKDKNKYLKAISRLRAQIGQRDPIVRGFIFGGKYFNDMMAIFEENRIPKELTRLPLVESAFNLNAKSKVGASGVWQFMRGTGNQYLRIDPNIDERNDPIAATKAAAQLLKENYEALGSWPLAVTAYNHGRRGVARAITATRSTQLHHIIRHHKAPSFGFASQNFYSEFLAILEVERDYKKHFGKMLVDSPLKYEKVKVLKTSLIHEIASRCQVSPKEIAEYNPALTDRVVSGRGQVPKGFQLKIPVGTRELCARPKPFLKSKSKSSSAQTIGFKLNSRS